MSSPARSLTSFSDDGPWELDLVSIPWRRGLDPLRVAARAKVPVLTRTRRSPPGARIGRTALVFARALGPWWWRERRQGNASSNSSAISNARLAARLRWAFERLGPTYIKLGQIIASGDGFLPDDVVAEFRGLRDRVPAFSFEQVRSIVEAELGRPLDQVFEHFDGVPIAAASIAQVHLATLRTGEEVAVKVQRPEIARLVEQDLAVMAWMAPILAARIDLLKVLNLPALIELFAETIVEELDFRLEADNMLDIASILDETDQRAIIVPRPHPELVTRRVLVMERLRGFSFDDVGGMRRAGVDTSAVIRACLVSLLEGAMIYGVFHGDLHGGNLFVHPDGRVILLDYGITGRLENERRQTFLRMLLAAIGGDHHAVLRGYQDLGAIPRGTDLDEFMRDVPVDRPVVDPATATADQMVAEMRRVTKALVRHGLRLPKELVLFMKNFMFIDGAIAALAPDLDILGELRHISEYFARQHGAQIVAEIGLAPDQFAVDTGSLLATVGLDTEQSSLTHREIQAQRQLVRTRLEEHRPQTPRR